MTQAPRVVLPSVVFILALLASTASAQHMYLDSNGNGISDAGDRLVSGCATTIDVWLRTDQSRSGAPAACNSGAESLTLNSYEFILVASGGTISWDSYTNAQASMSGPRNPISTADTYHVSYGGGTILAAGGYKLGTLVVHVTGGNPTIGFAQSTALSCEAATSFGTRCAGMAADFTYRLGTDWLDTDGVGTPVDLAPPVVTALATVAVEESSQVSVVVGASDCEPIGSLTADLSGLPAGNDASFTVSGDHTSGTLTWTPTLNDGGDHPVTFTASNAQSGTGTTVIHVINLDTLLPYSTSGFRYQEYGLATPFPAGIETLGFDDAGFSQGPSPFTDNSGCTTRTIHSPWASNSNLAVRRHLQLPSAVSGTTVRYVIDNDVQIYVNGTLVRYQVHDGCAQYGDFGDSLADGLLHQGDNIVTALCYDRGTSTYFDMWVTAQDIGPEVSVEPAVSLQGGGALVVGVHVSDPDNDPVNSLTADLSALPPGNNATFTSNPAHTEGQFEWTSVAADSGVFPVTFTASNALTGTGTLVITVTPGDRPPVVVAPATAEGLEMTPLVIAVATSDPDGDPIASLNAGLGALPGGNDAVFTTAPPFTSGTLTWTPTYSDSGGYDVTFTATNLQSGSDTTRIHVANLNRPPVFGSGTPQTVWEGELLTFSELATDPDGDALAYALACSPAGAALDSATHVISWTPSFSATRAESVCVSASDGALADTVVVPISVLDVPPGPIVLAVTDIGNDQGRQVDVHWKRSQYDAAGDGALITGYALYRRIDPLPALAPATEGWIVDASARAPLRQAQFPPGSWQYVLTAPARLETDYHVVAPTLADSTVATGPHETTFFVSALTDDPERFYDGAPGSGHSLDNLAPSVPGALLAQSLPGPQVKLWWRRVPDADARYYTVHRGSTPAFNLSPSNRVGATADTAFVDASPGVALWYYKVAAVDFSGNVGTPAVVSISVTEVPTESVPRALVLATARPNPASGAASIAFGVPVPGLVTLEVLSPNGRLVRRIVAETMGAGQYERLWDLRDGSGRRVGTGIYVCRLLHNGRTATSKIAVLR